MTTRGHARAQDRRQINGGSHLPPDETKLVKIVSVEAVVDDDVAQRRQVPPHAANFAVYLLVGNEQNFGTRISEDVLPVALFLSLRECGQNLRQCCAKCARPCTVQSTMLAASRIGINARFWPEFCLVHASAMHTSAILREYLHTHGLMPM
jgi:hypothetical protein